MLIVLCITSNATNFMMQGNWDHYKIVMVNRPNTLVEEQYNEKDSLYKECGFTTDKLNFLLLTQASENP